MRGVVDEVPLRGDDRHFRLHCGVGQVGKMFGRKIQQMSATTMPRIVSRIPAVEKEIVQNLSTISYLLRSYLSCFALFGFEFANTLMW